MRSFKALFLIFFCCYGPQLHGIPDTDKDTLIFRWTLYAKEMVLVPGENQDSGEEHMIIVEDSVRLTPGQRIKFLFQPVTRSYIYLFLYSSEKGMVLLFPGDMSLFINKEYTFNYYLFPAGKEWYSIPDISGREEFFLIVSNKRQNELEELAGKIRKKDKKDPEAGGFLYERLIQLLQEHCSPEVKANAYKEEFITVAGFLKGEGNDKLIEVTGQTLYIKRFEFIHGKQD